MTEESFRREIVSNVFYITPLAQNDSLLVTFFPNFLDAIGAVKSSIAMILALSTTSCVYDIFRHNVDICVIMSIFQVEFSLLLTVRFRKSQDYQAIMRNYKKQGWLNFANVHVILSVWHKLA